MVPPAVDGRDDDDVVALKLPLDDDIGDDDGIDGGGGPSRRSCATYY